MSFTIDMSDFLEFAADCEQAAAQVPQVFGDAAFEVGTLVQQKAIMNAEPHGRTRTMENSITPAMVTSGPSSAKAEVAVTAVSSTGFPYPIVVDQGRGEIVAKAGKALRFTGKDGNTYFRRRVKAYAGSRWFTRAVQDTQNSSDVEGVMSDATERLLSILRGR